MPQANQSCAMPHCPNEIRNRGQRFCGAHWHAVPEDLKDRLRTAIEDGRGMEFEKESAIQAIVTYLETDE